MFRNFAKRAAPLAALAMGAGLSGCGLMPDWKQEVEGVPLAELDMSGDAPTRITLAGPDKLVISEGDTLEITLEGSEDAGSALRFDRDGEKLTIARDQEIYDGSGNATIRMTIPAVSQLAIAGSGNIEATTMASDADIEIAGSGRISVASLSADELDVEIAGSGTVTAAGSARKLAVEMAGSGDVLMAELMADDVTIEIAGSGDVALSSNGSVDAEIAGSGDIVVTGSATCSLKSAGAGSLTCRPATEAAEAAIADESEAETAAD